MYSQLEKHLSENGRLTTFHFGFRRGLSTLHAVNTLSKSIHECLSLGIVAVRVFLHLTNAFDSLDRSILLQKLHYYCVKGDEIRWFLSFLQHRLQCSKCVKLSSSCTRVLFGVPRGSMFEPLLFLMFNNDIVKTTNLCKFFIYGDDTILLVSGKKSSPVER